MKEIRNIALGVLLANSMLYAFSFSSVTSSINTVKSYKKDLDSVNNQINGYIDDYTSLTNGFSIDSFNIAGLNLGFSAECNLPEPSASFDVCDMFKNKTGIDLFGQLEKNLNLGACKGSFSLGADDDMKDLMKSLCSLGTKNAEVSWNIQKVQQAELADAKSLSPIAKTKKIVENGVELAIKNVSYPNGKTTEDLYKEGGEISHKAISRSPDIPKEFRKAYATDDIVTYSAYERTAKLAKPSKNGDVDLKETTASAPETYLQYLSQEQAKITDLTALKPDMQSYENNIRQEIDRLIKKHNLMHLSGSTSSELRADYQQKVDKIAKDLLKVNIEKKNGKEIPYTTEYAKAIKGITEYEEVRFMLNEENYKRKHKTIIQPSLAKVKIQPSKKQLKYADRILMQMSNEVDRKVEFNHKISREKYKLANFTRRIFFESLPYNPQIAAKELEELLQ